MMVNLARGFAGHGADVAFVVSAPDLPYLDLLGPHVRIAHPSSPSRQRLPAFTRDLLTKERPDVVLSGKSEDDLIVLDARDAVACAARIFLRIGTHMSQTPSFRSANPLRRLLARRSLARLCSRADGLICVSEGVAEDMRRLSPATAARTHTIRNPVVTPELLASARCEATQRHRTEGEALVVAVGRLARVKRLDTLIRAFALALRLRPMKLVLAGEGREKADLSALARTLGIADRVVFTGFLANPYPLIASADLLVLSSEREGSPNVLVEAMALGTPVVSTDCPSGPSEILGAGRHGRLVPVDAPTALADAMLATLQSPPSAESLIDAVREYRMTESSAAYLDCFGLPAAPAGKIMDGTN